MLGPLLIAYIRQNTGSYGKALYVIAAIMLVSAVIPFIVRPPAAAPSTAETGDLRPRRVA
jgi:MFS transporter, OFA family, oxalate/formate antiporter